MTHPSLMDDFSAVGIATLVWSAVLLPLSRKRREARRQREEDDLFMHGSVGVKGVFSRVDSAPTRLQSVETRLGTVEVKLDSVVRMLTPNGGTTNDVGDLLQRIAKHLGEWVDEPVTRSRRHDDPEGGADAAGGQPV